jgi:hypothetical protein
LLQYFSFVGCKFIPELSHSLTACSGSASYISSTVVTPSGNALNQAGSGIHKHSLLVVKDREEHHPYMYENSLIKEHPFTAIALTIPIDMLKNEDSDPHIM